MNSMVSLLIWGAASYALLNLVAMLSLFAAYAWQHGLKPKLERRRTRKHRFERLLSQSSVDNVGSAVGREPASGGSGDVIGGLLMQGSP